tara:strand:- start:598 stop:954 length:357 start_codon:yes stop_codon:yes gene_type:complete
MRKKQRIKPVLTHMRQGRMRFKRRLDIPMWHPEHIQKTINMLRETADEIERVKRSNSLRESDQLMYSQMILQRANHHFASMSPIDPRERGTEMLEFTADGLIDKNGHAAVQARRDLLE